MKKTQEIKYKDEIWERILNSKYEISNYGRVRRFYKYKYRYLKTFNRKLKAEEVAYHKNEIISDNRLSNLQITTRSEAGKRTGWQSHRKSIVMLDNEGVIIKVFKGTRDAAKNLFISRQTVSDYCNKRVENPMYDLYWGDELIDKEGE